MGRPRGSASVDAAQGVATGAILLTCPSTRDADPAAVDGFPAVVAAYLLSGLDAPPPSGCLPMLRAHQRLMARVFADLVARHRGWAA